MIRELVAVGIVGGLGIALACSGKTVDGVHNDGGLSGGCPSSAPAQGIACAAMSLECEYGSDPNIACDTVARCDTKGWNVTSPSASGCPTPPLGPTCPATFAAVKEGAACSTPTTCGYQQGTCSCAVYCGPQYPLGHACDAGTPTTWHCEGGGGMGCPDGRPRIGSACATDQQACSYGDCNSIGVVCQSGTWHSALHGCPISTRHYKEGIHYLSVDERRAAAAEALDTQLATYQYTIGDRDPRLGFIIEDQPEQSHSVVHGKDRVDLYGYTSSTLAAVQVQQEEIRELQRLVQDLKDEVGHCQKR